MMAYSDKQCGIRVRGHVFWDLYKRRTIITDFNPAGEGYNSNNGSSLTGVTSVKDFAWPISDF